MDEADGDRKHYFSVSVTRSEAEESLLPFFGFVMWILRMCAHEQSVGTIRIGSNVDERLAEPLKVAAESGPAEARPGS